MTEPELTPLQEAATGALRKALPESRALILDTDYPDAACAVVAAVVGELAAEYERKRQESVIAATHAVVQTRAELGRVRSRLSGIEVKLAAHLNPKTDPCKDRGEPWPCHIAAAIEPDTSILEFTAQEENM